MKLSTSFFALRNRFKGTVHGRVAPALPRHPGLCCVMLVWLWAGTAEGQVSFNRDIRPILAEHCWQCHGFDQAARQAGLRLDAAEYAVLAGDSSQTAIVPGHPDQSELMRRITSDDDDVVMPPPSFKKSLTHQQKETLRRWITEGAKYQRHWSFEPLTRPPVPQIDGATHPIDAFIAERHRQHGLTFAPEASQSTLRRRVSLDLTGLPFDFEATEGKTDSYEKLVDRLLASPHFGERMAVDWLDAARYADTNGYFSDKPRQIWLWRDWVIDAFNRNMPFDQFTTEQLAGDLLPNASTSQRVATGFNRNHSANNETGIIDEEFRTEYVADRVDTTMTTWTGLTVACAQCHDHKYDPISHREFYQLFAFFNNVPETGLITKDDPPPVLMVSTPEQDRHIAELTEATAAASREFEGHRKKIAGHMQEWESAAAVSLTQPPTELLLLYESLNERSITNTTQLSGTALQFSRGIRAEAAKFDATQHLEQPLANFNADGPWTIGMWVLPDGSLSCPLSKIQPEGDRCGLEVLWQKGRVSVHLVHRWGVNAIEVSSIEPARSGEWHQLVIRFDGSQSADGVNLFIDGRLATVDVRRDALSGSLANHESLKIGRRDSGLGYYGLLDELRIVQQSLSDKAIADWFQGERLRGIIETNAASRSSKDTEILQDHFIQQHGDEEIKASLQRMKKAQQEERAMRASIPSTLVMQELSSPRETHVLQRGQYDQPGDAVSPGIPSAIGDWPAAAPRNRLGLAQWIVSKDNPLTARVAVNRLWMQCFGEGLVRTPNDFGTQGEPPTHPELLDWLAVRFRDSGWNVKDLLKLIVTSRTYRQDSAFQIAAGSIGDQRTVADPQNRWLARGPSFRLSSEMIRDQALAVSGLLQRRIGGPSVKPWQPPGLWEEVSYNAEDTYVPDTDAGRWRRSLYTYLKRQAPPPSFLVFDGVTREKCTVQRSRTNTPLQSLVLLNDRTFVEAARQAALLTLRTQTDDEILPYDGLLSPSKATTDKDVRRTLDKSSSDARLTTQMDDGDLLRRLFRRILQRTPDADEVRLLLDLLHRQRARFASMPESAEILLAVEMPGQIEPSIQRGTSSENESLKDVGMTGDPKPVEWAAWTVVAHCLFNLDEAVTRR